MNSEDNKPVAPVLLAEKFATAARMEDTRFAEQLEEVPRLRELLLAIQWFSFQPGGIAKLVNDVVAAVPGRIVDLEIKKVGLPGKDGQWTLEQTLAAWKLQHRVARSWRMDYWRIRGKSVYYRDDLEPAKPTDCPAPECGFEEWIGLCFDPELTADKVNRGTGCDRGIIMEGFRRFNYAYFHGDCLTVVAERLPCLACAQSHCCGRQALQRPHYIAL